jgi:hypothetical protein
MRRHHSDVEIVRRDSPRGLSAVGIFLFFGATMASFAGMTLIHLLIESGF